MSRNISLATFNLYNLQVAGGFVYGQKVKKPVYDKKLEWSSVILKQVNADVIAFQELWNRDCLEQLFEKAGLKSKYKRNYIGSSWGGIAVAVAVRKPWKIVDKKTHKSFPEGFKLLKRRRGVTQDQDREDDEIDVKIDRFSRTIIQLTIEHEHGSVPPIEVFCLHLKAKLPTKLDSAEMDNALVAPHANALGAAISTIRRMAEAAALRVLLNGVMKDTKTPVVVLGDFNDGILSNALSTISGQPPYQLFQAKRVSQSRRAREKRDRGLYSATMLQQYHSLRDVYYTHNFQGVVETLDHILVSEQFYDHSPDRVWSFKAMRIWNDHVDEHDPREKDPDKTVSDHGVVRAEFVHEG